LGNAAILVNPANEVEIAQALRSFLPDRAKREELIRRGKERAHRFTEKDFAEVLLGYWTNLSQYDGAGPLNRQTLPACNFGFRLQWVSRREFPFRCLV
jgi:hypothetical protein